MAPIASAKHLGMFSIEIGNISTNLDPDVSTSQIKWCRVLAENSISITGVNERMKGRSSTPVERIPYSGRSPAGRKDALGIGREDGLNTPLGGQESEVDQTGVMAQYNDALQ
jgi:hypothetical protein